MLKPGKGCAAAVRWTEEWPLSGVDPDVGLEVGQLEVGLPARFLLASEWTHPGVLLSLLGPEEKDIKKMNKGTTSLTCIYVKLNKLEMTFN